MDLGLTLYGCSDLLGLEGAREAALSTPTLVAEPNHHGFTCCPGFALGTVGVGGILARQRDSKL